MSEAQPNNGGILDDADPESRNQALQTELDNLTEDYLDTKKQLKDLADRVVALHGVQTVGLLSPEQVRELYSAVQTAIGAFVGPMDRFIRDNSEHKARVDAGMLSEGSAKAFRSALSANTELQAAAVDPNTGVIDIWIAYIWRYLLQTIFSEAGTLDFYSNAGQNASYYIKNVNEMEYLMTLANPPVFGLYSRRTWRRQALFSIFRKADFDWVTTNRAAKIQARSDDLLRAFRLFARPFPDGRALELIRDIVNAAVELNEHIMIEADDLWTIELEGVAGSEDDFYNNMTDLDLKPVGTLSALQDNAPLDAITRRLNMDLVKQRVKKLCVVAPALRYQHVQPQGEGYGDVVHLVKPQVLVAIKEILPANVLATYELHDELVFYSMAKSLGLIPEPIVNPQ